MLAVFDTCNTLNAGSIMVSWNLSGASTRFTAVPASESQLPLTLPSRLCLGFVQHRTMDIQQHHADWRDIGAFSLQPTV